MSKVLNNTDYIRPFSQEEMEEILIKKVQKAQKKG
jgi:hypothetical protein